MKFRKKPVVIEAVQVTAADYNGKSFDGSPFSEVPDWLQRALADGTVSVYPGHETDYALWKIKTLEDGPNGEAKHIAEPGDWIIRGIKGELYPCKPDIFEKTYEPVTEKGQ
jgi:hypothetical protein